MGINQPKEVSIDVCFGVQDSPKHPNLSLDSVVQNHGFKLTPSLVPPTPNPGPFSTGSLGPCPWPGLKVWRRSVARLNG